MATIQERFGFHGILLAVVSRHGKSGLFNFFKETVHPCAEESLEPAAQANEILLENVVDSTIFSLGDIWNEEEQELFISRLEELTIDDLNFSTLIKVIQNSCPTYGTEKVEPAWWTASNSIHGDSNHSDVIHLMKLHQELCDAEQTNMSKDDFVSKWPVATSALMHLLQDSRFSQKKYDDFFERCLTFKSLTEYLELLDEIDESGFSKSTSTDDDSGVSDDEGVCKQLQNLQFSESDVEEDSVIEPDIEDEKFIWADQETDSAVVSEDTVVVSDAVDGLVFSSAINAYKAPLVFADDAENLGLPVFHKLKKEGKLGKGGFGKVYLYRDIASRMLVAVKKDASSYSRNRRKVLLNEIALMRTLSHDRVVKYYGAIEEKGKLLLFMEYLKFGSVTDLINAKGRLPEHVVKKFTKQILEGVVYLNSKLIIHRDIKSANALLTDDCNIKLTDFGLSLQLVDVMDATRGRVGTLCFMAPEVIRGERYGTKADVWSVGCTVLEMLTGHAPWRKVRDEDDLAYKIANFTPLGELPHTASLLLRYFLKKLFVIHPQKRPTARQLLYDDYFSS